MMRYFTLTASVLAALFLSACAEAPQSDSSSGQSPDLTSADTPPVQPTITPQESVQAAPTADNSVIPERYQGLDPRDITQAEIDEFIAGQAFQRAARAWSMQDPETRGPQPQWEDPLQTERSRELRDKFRIAEFRKSHNDLDPNILSKAELEELIAIQKAQNRFEMKMRAWRKLDPATRGSQPELDPQDNPMNSLRTQELQAKVKAARDVKRVTDRIEKLSKAYNIPILDNERSELIRLQKEEQKLQGEMQQAIMKALVSPDGKFNAEGLKGGKVSGEVIDKLPRDLLLRMSEVSERREAIEAPFLAAEKADKICKDMAKLSETSGVPISSVEIEETIALNVEKDRIIKSTQYAAMLKWRAEGGPVSAVQNALPNAQDAARLEEIEARLNAISAPMRGAK